MGWSGRGLPLPFSRQGDHISFYIFSIYTLIMPQKPPSQATPPPIPVWARKPSSQPFKEAALQHERHAAPQQVMQDDISTTQFIIGKGELRESITRVPGRKAITPPAPAELAKSSTTSYFIARTPSPDALAEKPEARIVNLLDRPLQEPDGLRQYYVFRMLGTVGNLIEHAVDVKPMRLTDYQLMDSAFKAEIVTKTMVPAPKKAGPEKDPWERVLRGAKMGKP